MSAPLVVNTQDGVCWTRRTVTPGGIALYAPESVQTCPNFVMATLAELAEHGIAGSADALPVPVGTAPLAPQGRPRTMLDHAREALNARMTKDDLRLVLENVITYAAELESRLSEQAEAARSVHVKYPDSEHCQHDGERWPCPTVAALGDGEHAPTSNVVRIVAEVSNADDHADAMYAQDRVEYTLKEHGYTARVWSEGGAAAAETGGV